MDSLSEYYKSRERVYMCKIYEHYLYQWWVGSSVNGDDWDTLLMVMRVVNSICDEEGDTDE